MRKYIIGSGEFQRRKLREFEGAGITPAIRREFDTTVRAVSGESRQLEFIISTGSVDRYGDTVAVNGWKLENFRKNPMVLWMHDGTMLPVAKAVSVRIEGGSLKARAEFTPAGQVRYNDIVFNMLQTGFLSATSVGFIPLKFQFVENDPKRPMGINFLEQELLEFSVVTVPANAEALIESATALPDHPSKHGNARADATGAADDFTVASAKRRLAALKSR